MRRGIRSPGGESRKTNWYYRYMATHLWEKMAFSVMATAVALWIGSAFLHNIMSDQIPFLLFLVPVAISAWFGGFVCGMAAAILCSLTFVLFFIPPVYSFSFAT